MQHYHEQYNTLAEAYKKFSEGNKEITYVSEPLLAELIGEVAGKELLDIGCGGGFQLAAFDQKNAKTLMGIDSSAEQIEICKAQLPAHINVMVANASADDFVQTVTGGGSQRFDVIYHSLVQVHNETPELMQQFWQNIYDLLKDGGIAVGITSDPKTSMPSGAAKIMDLSYDYSDTKTLADGDPYTVHLLDDLAIPCYYWSYEGVAPMLETAGFKSVTKICAHDNPVSRQAFSAEEIATIENAGAVYAVVGIK